MSKTEKKSSNSFLVIFGFISLSLLFFISLISHKTGIVGEIIRKILFSGFGFGAYFIPFIILFIIISAAIKKSYDLKDIIYITILFISFLIAIDIYNNGSSEIFSLRIKENIELSSEGIGSGIIGASFGFIFLKFFGTVGTYLIIILAAFITTLHFTKIDIRTLFVKLKNRIKTMIKDYKLKNKNSTKEKFDFKKFISKFKKEKEIHDDHDDNNNSILDSELIEEVYISDDCINDDIIITDYNQNNNIEYVEDIVNENVTTDINSLEDKIIEEKIENIYIYPKTELLNQIKINKNIDNRHNLAQAKQIEKTMKDFNIDAKVTQINRGPTITCYELEPAPGVKISRILGLADNLSLALATSDIRIEAPIPGKSAIGIEVPNAVNDNVFLREILENDKFVNFESNLPLVLGKDISGMPMISSIDKMPHLLIAGATGSGKSVCINTIIISLLYKSTPDDVKLLLIDPKVVELSIYNDIPHLLLPVVTSPKDARFALKWAVDEMEKRYKTFAENNVRDIGSYNKLEREKFSKIVIIIDELADLMMVAAQEIEEYICRLAQMARAAGIYLIIATQRPSVDVITGTIKANIPSRISFAVSSQIDSRTILDMGGAEKLLGKGDMLFYPSDLPKPKRIQGAFITDEEVYRVVNFVKENHSVEYDEEIINDIKEKITSDSLDVKDELFDKALEIIVNQKEASISMLQRKLKIGYNRAANIIDIMYENGFVGEQEGNKPRKVLIDNDDLENIIKGEL